MRTSQDYREKLKSMRQNVYIDGQLVTRDDPRLVGGVNIMAATLDLATDPEFEPLLTATSHVTGEKINRFCHIHQNVDDLMKKQEMTRKLCGRVGGCVARCMGIDAMNALSVITYMADDANKTEYYPRWLEYLKWFQKNNVVGCCAQTDVKGDRSKRPHQQADPDLYLRIIERKKDGIIVRGAKAHNSYAPNAEEIIVTPTRFLTKEEGDWAVAFAIPGDAKGVHQVIRPAAPRPRKYLKAPIAEIGGADSLTIFDDTFVPWDRVFLCGEAPFGGQLALLFALYHRHSYTGCKPGMADVMMGAAALVAEYNGVPRADHVRDKLADMIAVAELVYAGGIASAVKSQKSPSGTQIPDVVFANVARYHAGVNVYHEYEVLADLAGGLSATLPPEGDFYHEQIGPLLNKYIMRSPSVSAEDQHRLYRYISDTICSGHAGVMQIAGIHGGGSPIMEKIAIMGQYDIESKKKLVKYLAGIKQ